MKRGARTFRLKSSRRRNRKVMSNLSVLFFAGYLAHGFAKAEQTSIHTGKCIRRFRKVLKVGVNERAKFRVRKGRAAPYNDPYFIHLWRLETNSQHTAARRSGCSKQQNFHK